jgi:predicted transcriptional regulator
LRSVADILNAISDDKSLLLFNTIAITNGETEIQVRKMGLTLKQYYLRMAKLTKADLIRRKNGRYFLTLMGKIVYEAHMTIGKALNYYWKLQALESIQTSSPDGLPKEEISKLVDTLIDDYQIKDMLMKITLPTEDQKSRESTPQITTGAKEKMRLEKLVSYR